MKHLQTRKKYKKAYSLVEVIISMAVIAVILTILFNTILITLRISFKNYSRSVIREEITEVASSISRDVRNADLVLGCGGIPATNNCSVVLDGKIIQWYICDNKICKDESIDGVSFVNVYTSPNNFEVVQLDFSNGFSSDTNQAQTNILFTIVASHTNKNLNISNIIRQQSVSTRNYVR